MVKSMTAYARAVFSSNLGKWTVEIHSVNKKSLDFHVHMSKDFLFFDLQIRKWLSARIHRGQVSCRVSFESQSATVSLGRLQKLKCQMETVSEGLGLPAEEITLPFLYEEAKHLPLDLSGQDEALASDLKHAVDEALDLFISMRQTEGRALVNAFKENLTLLKGLLNEIEGALTTIETRRRKRLEEKLSEYKEVFEEDQERVLREVFFYVEKSDVTEEIVRLKSHMNQFEALLLLSEDRALGKSMEFLVQEMSREMNTMASKSDDLEVSKGLLRMKSELEKIREQVQNVE